MEISMVKENLFEVEDRICEACKKSGRRRGDVKLIAVSKTKPVSLIEEAYASGTLGKISLRSLRKSMRRFQRISAGI